MRSHIALILAMVGCSPTAERAATSSDAAASVLPADIDRLPLWRATLERQIPDSTAGDQYALHMARSPVQLADGRIALANAQYEILFFDENGRLHSRVGRRGQGPGEYRQLWSLARLAGDTLIAYDAANARATLLAADADVLRSHTLVAPFGVPPGIHWLADGSAVYIVHDLGRLVVKYGARGADEVRDTTWLVRVRPDGSARDTLAAVPGRWVSVQGSWVQQIALSGDHILATGPDFIVTGFGDDFRLTWRDAAGQILRQVHVDAPRVPVNDSIVAEYREAVRNQIARARAEGAPMRERFARHAPAITDAVVDRDAFTWVRRWSAHSAANAEWLIFHRDGKPAGRIALPAALRVSDIGSDYLLGVFSDEDGVQRLQRYHVQRDSAR